jgi:hypothetical protein
MAHWVVRSDAKALSIPMLAPVLVGEPDPTPDRVEGRLRRNMRQSMVPKSGYRFSEKDHAQT